LKNRRKTKRRPFQPHRAPVYSWKKARSNSLAINELREGKSQKKGDKGGGERQTTIGGPHAP